MTSDPGSAARVLPARAFGLLPRGFRPVCRIAVVAAAFSAFVGPAQASPREDGPSSGPPQTSTAPSAGGAVVVVELFTSQGCSSCPPADRLLARLGEQAAPKVVALAYHVDFWNHAGWTDPFSSHDWTERQIAYARKFGLEQVYTPQAVIDGAKQLVGSDESAIPAAIAAAAGRPAGRITLQLETSGSEILVEPNVEVPDALRGRKLTLYLAVYETGLVTSVGKGENGGSVLHDDYVVRSLKSGPRFEAGESGRKSPRISLKLSRDWNVSRLGVAAFLQDPRTLEIFGAASQSLAAAPPAVPGGRQSR